MNTTETFYKMGKAAFLPLLAGMFFFGQIDIEALRWLPQCTFYRITGLVCPGCGGTRAIYHFARGNWMTSLRYHPAILYLLLSYILVMLSCLIYKKSGRTAITIRKPEYFCYAGIVLILLQWLLKIAGIWIMPT